MKYIVSFLFWIFLTLWVFFWYTEVTTNLQYISNKNISFGDLVTEKINNLRESIKHISWKNLTDDWDYEKINKIKEILDKWYIKPSYVSWSQMWDKAMQAYVSAIWDPFTVYLTSKDNKSLHEELKWSSDFEGIWAVVTKVPEWISIEQVIKYGPAFKSGIKPLDIILKAEGVDLSKLPLWKWIENIKWPKWTIVDLTIKRDGKIINIKVKRDKVELKSVQSKIINYKWKKIWYISISTVWQQTYDQFIKQSKQLLSKGINWLILDLRWNGGWYLDIWYDIWSMWAKKGDIVVQARYRYITQNKIYTSFIDGKFNNFPTIVLIDDYTASAWEIITAAIKENNPKTVKLVWTKTFWKWTIQTMNEFRDWSSLKYTIWKWYTPKNENLSNGVKPGNGIKPDVEVKFDSKLYKEKHIDNQLEISKKTLITLLNK